MNVAIVGSRDYPDMAAVRSYVRTLPNGTTVVSGGARGVDSVAEAAARNGGLAVRIFEAQWDKHGRRAGFLRNQDIVAAADKVVAFWDGTSRGTEHTIVLALKEGVDVAVFDRNGKASTYEDAKRSETPPPSVGSTSSSAPAPSATDNILVGL